MLRAPNLPSSSQFLVSSFRFPMFSYVSFSSFNFLKRSSTCLIRRAFPKTPGTRFSTSSGFPFFGREPSMQSTPRPHGKGCSVGDSKEILVHHLLVEEKDLKLLTELQQRIAGGEDLSDLAVEYSICPSKENGGMLGWVRRGQLVPEFEKAAFSATLNKVVRCKTEFGWHLLEVLCEREESILGEIEPLDLHSKMQDPNFIQEAQLIDVREQEEVFEASCSQSSLPIPSTANHNQPLPLIRSKTPRNHKEKPFSPSFFGSHSFFLSAPIPGIAGIVTKKLNVHLVPHTHDDVGWLKTVEQYYVGSNNSIQGACVRNVLDLVVSALLEDKNRKFIYVEPTFFRHWWRQQSNAIKKIVKGLISSGQLALINGGMCMHDEAAPHYIDMIDQTTLGHRFLKQEFGQIPRIGWQIDPFGHSAIQAYLLLAELFHKQILHAQIISCSPWELILSINMQIHGSDNRTSLFIMLIRFEGLVMFIGSLRDEIRLWCRKIPLATFIRAYRVSQNC